MIGDLEQLSSLVGESAQPCHSTPCLTPFTKNAFTDRESPDLSSWRHDPLTDRCVRVAAGRADRPNDFADDGAAKKPCPFCRGAEERTPAATDRVEDSAGGWLTRVVPNRFPVVEGDDGAHEVVIESPRHVSRYLDLTVEERVAAVAAWARRMSHWRNDGRFDCQLMFKNEGPAAGASLSHIHSQIIAFPVAPPVVGPMWERLAAAPDTLGGLPAATLDGWQVISPPAPRGAFEAWILPAGAPQPFSEADAPSLSAVLARVIGAIGAEAFNLVLQMPPTSAPANIQSRWWLEVIPRTSTIAGIELATGRWINSVSPESAAEKLRERLTAGA